MKDYLKLGAAVFFLAGILAIPVLFYGSIAYVVVHFVKKFW